MKVKSILITNSTMAKLITNCHSKQKKIHLQPRYADCSAGQQAETARSSFALKITQSKRSSFAFKDHTASSQSQAWKDRCSALSRGERQGRARHTDVRGSHRREMLSVGSVWVPSGKQLGRAVLEPTGQGRLHTGEGGRSRKKGGDVGGEIGEMGKRAPSLGGLRAAFSF